jgi:hypothetical protein
MVDAHPEQQPTDHVRVTALEQSGRRVVACCKSVWMSGKPRQVVPGCAPMTMRRFPRRSKSVRRLTRSPGDGLTQRRPDWPL